MWFWPHYDTEHLLVGSLLCLATVSPFGIKNTFLDFITAKNWSTVGFLGGRLMSSGQIKILKTLNTIVGLLSMVDFVHVVLMPYHHLYALIIQCDRIKKEDETLLKVLRSWHIHLIALIFSFSSSFSPSTCISARHGKWWKNMEMSVLRDQKTKTNFFPSHSIFLVTTQNIWWSLEGPSPCQTGPESCDWYRIEKKPSLVFCMGLPLENTEVNQTNGISQLHDRKVSNQNRGFKLSLTW